MNETIWSFGNLQKPFIKMNINYHIQTFCKIPFNAYQALSGVIRGRWKTRLDQINWLQDKLA